MNPVQSCSSAAHGTSAPVPQWIKSALDRALFSDLAHPEEVENYRRSLQAWFLGYLRYYDDSITELNEAEIYRFEILSDFLAEISRQHTDALTNRVSVSQAYPPEVANLLEQHNQLTKDRAQQFYEDRLAEKEKLINQLQESNDQLFKLLNEWKSKLAEKEAATAGQEGGQAA